MLELMGAILRYENKERYDFIDKEVHSLWDNPMPNKEKKNLVMMKARHEFSDSQSTLIDFIIKFIVTMTRMKLKDK